MAVVSSKHVGLSCLFLFLSTPGFRKGFAHDEFTDSDEHQRIFSKAFASCLSVTMLDVLE